MSTNAGLHRSKSDPPPPITVEDTATGEPPQPSPSPTRMNSPRGFTSYTRPPLERGESTPLLREGRRRPTVGHRRKHSPNLEWHEKWDKDTWKQGRVLLIDYVDREHAAGRRKVVAQEFCDIDSLRRFYRKEDLSAQAALRVIHVQNAGWATRFLLRKFNIDASDDLVGTTFGRWARYDRPQLRGGKPVLNGKTFRAQRDPWRGISRAAFGCDYLKYYDKHTPVTAPGVTRPMMELHHYDENDQPAYGYDVHVQRLSVYVQISEGEPGQAVDPDIPNPYNEEAYEEYQRLKKQYGNVDANEHQEKYIPKLRTLDNSNTIIIFENSVTGSVKDTLIGARQEIESRWRRLTFYLPREDVQSDETLCTQCMEFILKDIFKAVSYNWNKFLSVAETHVSILEDKIYENPADESRAPELWKNSAQWLKVERLIYIHADLAEEMRGHLHELAGEDPREDELWLGSAPEDLLKLTGQWERDIVQPTTALSDLMYKSVGIRDSRDSLQLGLSMWRLSWITFIFLPLTFTVGFFGMNVDIFADNPGIKWWFITSIPVLLVVMILWYGVKHTLSSQRQNPLRRGVYEALYHEFAMEHSTLWTRRGPRKGVIPVGWWNAVKWRFITTWFGDDKLKIGTTNDPATQEFGVWSRTKRWLARRWLSDLTVMPITSADQLQAFQQEQQHQHSQQPSDTLPLKGSQIDVVDLGAVGELLSIATPVAIAELDPTAASKLHSRLPIQQQQRQQQQRSSSLSPSPARNYHEAGTSGRRPSSEGAMSGVMVEEKGPSEDERSADEEEEEIQTRDDMKRLDVPLTNVVNRSRSSGVNQDITK